MASRGSKFLHFSGKLWGEFEKQPPKPPFFVLCGIQIRFVEFFSRPYLKILVYLFTCVRG
jgi:hypothetical protein